MSLRKKNDITLAFFLRSYERLNKETEQGMPYRETPVTEWSAELEQHILRAIKNVRYGSVEIIIHDSQVVQIERKEKIRFSHTREENKK